MLLIENNINGWMDRLDGRKYTPLTFTVNGKKCTAYSSNRFKIDECLMEYYVVLVVVSCAKAFEYE